MCRAGSRTGCYHARGIAPRRISSSTEAPAAAMVGDVTIRTPLVLSRAPEKRIESSSLMDDVHIPLAVNRMRRRKGGRGRLLEAQRLAHGLTQEERRASSAASAAVGRTPGRSLRLLCGSPGKDVLADLVEAIILHPTRRGPEVELRENLRGLLKLETPGKRPGPECKTGGSGGRIWSPSQDLLSQVKLLDHMKQRVSDLEGLLDRSDTLKRPSFGSSKRPTPRFSEIWGSHFLGQRRIYA